MDGLHINSGSVLINTKRHGQRKPNRDPTGSGSFECSKQSILSSMDKFVRTVQSMRSTILVPSRLRDMRLRPRLPDCQITLLANSAAGQKPHHGAAGQLAKSKPLNSTNSTAKSSSHHKFHSHFHTSHHHSLLHNHHPDYHRSQAYHHSIHSNASSTCDPSAGKLNYDPAEIPSALINADLYNFYSMLYDVKQQLLWGPASGQSTIYTNYTANSDQSNARFMMEKSALHQLNSTMANCNLSGSEHSSVPGAHSHAGLLKEEHRAESTCSSGYSSNSSTRNSTTNLSFIAQCSSPTTSIANCSTSSTNSLSTRPPSAAQNSIEDSPGADQRTPADQVDGRSAPADACSNTAEACSAQLIGDANQEDAKLNDSAVSSSSSIVDSSSSVTDSSNKLVDSPQSKTPQSDSDLESELESDSILTDRTSEQITDQTQMLASAFRHHLQALHTILDTLTHSADYMERSWELEMSEESS